MLDLLETFEQGAPRQALTHNLRFWEFYDRLVAPHRDPWAAFVLPLGRSHLIDGLAVFSGDRLAGVLRDEEATAFGWFLPEPFTPSVFTLPPPAGGSGERGDAGPGETVAFRLKQVRTALRIVSTEPKRLVAGLRAAVFVIEGLPVTERRPPDPELWQARVEQVIVGAAARLFDRLRAWRADPLGLSEPFRRRDPRLVERWRDDLPLLEVEVQPRLLLRLGMRGRAVGP